MTTSRQWSLGAVLDEQRVDDFTHLLVVRPDAPAPACRDLERRLLGLSLAGVSTLIVDLAGGGRVSEALTEALLRAQRRIGSRSGRLLVSVEHPEAAADLEFAGLDVIDLNVIDLNNGMPGALAGA